jgi:hypothetical protein
MTAVGPVVPYADHLLPTSSSELMQALSATGKRITQIPVPIDTVKQPQATPAQFLAFLAWERSVDIWNQDWPDQIKRNVIAASIPLHFKKGTAYAIEQYVRYVGGTVLKFDKPPAKIFSGPSLTRAERESWLETLPQVRVYYFRDTGTAGPHKAFIGSQFSANTKSRNFYSAGMFSIPSIALQHLERKATWNVNGVDTDTTVTDFGNYYQLHFVGSAGEKVFTHTPSNAGKFFIPSDAWRRLATIMPNTTTPWRIAVGPTFQAITAQPELVTEPGQRGRSVFTGSNYVHGTGSLMGHRNYFIPSTSKYRVFDRYAVFDGSTGLKRPNTQFMGTGRYGFPAHTAIMHVSVPSTRSPWAASSDGVFIPKTRFWVPHNPEPMKLVRWATEAAKRLSDKILIQSGPIAAFVAGRPFIAGVDSYVVGSPRA